MSGKSVFVASAVVLAAGFSVVAGLAYIFNDPDKVKNALEQDHNFTDVQVETGPAWPLFSKCGRKLGNHFTAVNAIGQKVSGLGCYHGFQDDVAIIIEKPNP